MTATVVPAPARTATSSLLSDGSWDLPEPDPLTHPLPSDHSPPPSHPATRSQPTSLAAPGAPVGTSSRIFRWIPIRLFLGLCFGISLAYYGTEWVTLLLVLTGTLTRPAAAPGVATDDDEALWTIDEGPLVILQFSWFSCVLPWLLVGFVAMLWSSRQWSRRFQFGWMGQGFLYFGAMCILLDTSPLASLLPGYPFLVAFMSIFNFFLLYSSIRFSKSLVLLAEKRGLNDPLSKEEAGWGPK